MSRRSRCWPGTGDHHHHRGRAAYASNQWSEAVAEFSKAIELNREEVSGYLLRGQALLRLTEIERAAADFEKAIELKPNDALAYNNLAWYYAVGPTNFRSPEKALPVALKADELTKTNHNELNTLGVVYYRLGQLTNAIATLEQGIKADSAGGSAHDFFFLAMAHQRLGDAQKAEAYFAKAVKWMEEQRSLSANGKEELESFRAEAEAVLARLKAK